MRGEWIEIYYLYVLERTIKTSLPMRGEWIEIVYYRIHLHIVGSLPMRGEWIEIVRLAAPNQYTMVSPHAGRVD